MALFSPLFCASFLLLSFCFSICAFLPQINEVENEIAEFIHRNPLTIDHRIALVQLIFEHQTELILANEQISFPKDISSDDLAFPYEMLVSKITSENFEELAQNLRQNALKLAKESTGKFHFLTENDFYGQFVNYLAKIAQLKVEEALKQRREKDKLDELSEKEKNDFSEGWKSLQMFVEMYSFGSELFMQLAANYGGKLPKKTRKTMKKLVAKKMPQMDELCQQFVDYFQAKFMKSISQNLSIEPMNAQKIIDQNDTATAWANWFREIGDITHSAENDEEESNFV
ncbi:hypothetical protein niasHS_015200 [Heterodera schachtii]|uniref:Uncharacterized protein n=1 Tax=Heterodera schachtii TaxID=97005 RepID=A0ABD2IAX5_HETSC